jgi:ubiquitin carboxyl-terminal hydrolase 36/42
MNYSNISKGLQNLGNTCFFNSILQLLFQCTVLNKLLIDNDINGTLINIYKRFLTSYISDTSETNSIINPQEIVSYVSQILGRRNWEQEDADQYITFIIDSIIEEFKEWSKTSLSVTVANKNMSLDELIYNLFTIGVEKELFCPECKYISKTNDDVNKLYLAIDPINMYSSTSTDNSLNNLINKYLEESLDEENMWKCDKCNQMVKANIKRNINKLPKYLIITLKRYGNNNMKIETEIDMPLYFSCMNKTYYSRGFVYHSGSTRGGHYVYYGSRNSINKLQNSSPSQIEWYLYNDSSVSKIDLDTLNNVRKTGYIYLYVSK